VYAVPITPDKFPDAAALTNRLEHFAIMVDSAAMAAAVCVGLGRILALYHRSSTAYQILL
jgi:hypothetical protein